MNYNSAIELLCKLLEERGVSCQTNYLHTSWRVGSKLYDAVDNFDGTLTVDNLTPEQAIAATLGSGTLTANQVSKATYAHGIHVDCADADWQAIADVLNSELWNGTCEMVVSGTPCEGNTDVACKNDWAKFGKFKCSECGLQVDSISTGTTAPIPIAFCPRCGAKMVNE